MRRWYNTEKALGDFDATEALPLRRRRCQCLPKHVTGDGDAMLPCPGPGRERGRGRPPLPVPLLAALFSSLVAVTLSVRIHASSRFVTLREPLRVSPFFKKIDYVGLSALELCAIRQDALGDIVSEEEEETGDVSAEVATKLPIPTSNIITTATDVQRNITSYVLTTYHHYTPHSAKQSTEAARPRSRLAPNVDVTASWMEEPDHDDVLVSAGFPYNDDDAYASDLPEEYWSCHVLRLDSKSASSDVKRNWSRVCFAMGSMVGICSSCLLTALILCRNQDAKKRWRDRRRERHETLDRNKMHARMQRQHDDERVTSQPNENISAASQQYQMLSLTNSFPLLDTNSSGYRAISTCFLLSYQLQSLTFLFLDSDICREQVCSMSTGAHALILSCILWIMSALLVLFAMKQIRNNERQERLLKRKAALVHANMLDAAEDSQIKDLRINLDAKFCVFDPDGQVLDADSVLDTTIETGDTESSESCLLEA